MRTKQKKINEAGDAPAMSSSDIAAIDSYLGYMLAKMELALNNQKSAHMECPSPQSAGQVAHFRGITQTIRWLLKVNSQWKARDEN